jgi:hypothetical protein
MFEIIALLKFAGKKGRSTRSFDDDQEKKWIKMIVELRFRHL